MNNRRCIALFSGGLDSFLAVKIIQQQNIEVLPVYFDTGFFFDIISKIDGILIYKPETPQDIKVKVIDISCDFFNMVKSPIYGFGSNMNPCIDCKILMLKKAKELLNEYDAGFVITGEVLGQRPMTQNINSLKILEEKSGLSGLLLRPLSAKNLPETTPEKLKWVDREKLLNFKGRTRKPQLKLAEELGLKKYIKTPAGGCILTDKNYSERLRNFIKNEENLTKDEAFLLTLGRHFRFNKIKFIIGRNKFENEKLLNYKGKESINLFDTVDVPGPVCIATGILNEEEKKFIASAVARYSDGKNLKNVKIYFFDGKKEEIIITNSADDEALKKFII